MSLELDNLMRSNAAGCLQVILMSKLIKDDRLTPAQKLHFTDMIESAGAEYQSSLHRDRQEVER